MSHRQFREVRLRDFRCFAEPQTARLAPLPLLVGANSTGKTSFLAAVQAVWDAAQGDRIRRTGCSPLEGRVGSGRRDQIKGTTCSHQP